MSDKEMNVDYVQYGCGWSAPEAWNNFDASPTLRFERLPLIGKLYTKNEQRFPKNVSYGDIVAGLPIAPNFCSGVYCSHILEHLSLHDATRALKNTHLILKEGGIFRLVLPDLKFCVETYLNNRSAAAATEFLKSTMLGRENRPKGVRGLLVAMLGNNEHLWMWDYKSLELELLQAGFRNIRRAKYGDSTDPMFKLVESPERWENCLGIECQK